MAILHGLEGGPRFTDAELMTGTPTGGTLTAVAKQCTLCREAGSVVDFVCHPDDRSNGGIMLLCSLHSRQYHLSLVLGRTAEFLAYADEMIRSVVR